ncbi:hypothetical protein ACQEVC_42775 [Plantactinospora sp. CA-294935]|uniref:hypothetical protein n=1 Tax=Plantactinospora sp. CA-294935 TaxID=3240012 RepID=UPI003D8C61F1
MLGIAGYEPVVTDTVDEAHRVHGPALNALVGRRLGAVRGLCFVIDGEWCVTAPLILDFDGPCMELHFDGFDQMYLSWNSIDVDAPIDTPDQEDPDMALAWADPHSAELSHVIGSTVRQVWLLEHDFRLDRPDGQCLQAWILAGIELAFDEGWLLQLYNVFSELRVATHPAGSDIWRRRAVQG